MKIWNTFSQNTFGRSVFSEREPACWSQMDQSSRARHTWVQILSWCLTWITRLQLSSSFSVKLR